MGRKAACAPEREKQPSPSPPLPPIPSGSLARSLAALSSVDLGAFHAETVGKGGERGETLWSWRKSLFARAPT